MRDIPKKRLQEATEVPNNLTLLAVLCGAEGWEDIEDFGNSHKDWLASFLELPRGFHSGGRNAVSAHPRALAD